MNRDIKKLLRPIPGQQKCGEDLRYDKVYDDIKKARFSEDATLPQGVWVRTIEEAQWDVVATLCTDVLVHKSKDLQVACWLMESWFHDDGLRGVVDGLTLVYALLRKYWVDLHPTLQTGCRLSPFHWINEKFSTVLLKLPLEQGEELKIYTFSDYKKIKMAPERNDELTLVDFLKRLKNTSQDYFKDIVEQAQAALDLALDLEKFIERKIGSEEMSLYRFRQYLSEIQTLCDSMIIKPIESPQETMVLKIDNPFPEKRVSDVFQENTPQKDGLIIANHRGLAYQKIEEIADYLEKIEPHSPTPYLLRKAILWGQMSLQELLQEFIKSGMNLQQMQTWIGLPKQFASVSPPGDEEEGGQAQPSKKANA